MLTEQQVSHFNTFGFVILRQLLKSGRTENHQC